LLTVDLRGKQGDIPAGRLEPGPRPCGRDQRRVRVCVRSGAVAAAEKVAAPTSVTKRRRK
jgi:hypothetical protein